MGIQDGCGSESRILQIEILRFRGMNLSMDTGAGVWLKKGACAVYTV